MSGQIGSARILLPIPRGEICIDGLGEEEFCEEPATTMRWRGGWEFTCRQHGGLTLAA